MAKYRVVFRTKIEYPEIDAENREDAIKEACLIFDETWDGDLSTLFDVEVKEL